MKKEIPILFSTPMVQALPPAGPKTNTRRTRGLDDINQAPDEWLFDHFEENAKGGLNAVFANRENPQYSSSIPCPYGKPGDFLWVRETWRKYCRVDDNGYTRFDEEVIEYAADGHGFLPLVDGDGFRMYDKKGNERGVPWKPSIHMPKSAARIWLEVEEIRVERLHDISEEDACDEGIESDKLGELWRDYLTPDDNPERCLLIEPSASFETLWVKINGVDSWKANPWVWVVKFKVLSTTGKPAQQEKEAEAEA